MLARMPGFLCILPNQRHHLDSRGRRRRRLEPHLASHLYESRGRHRGDGAGRAAADYRNALRYLRQRSARWEVPVETCSALENRGIGEIWALVERFRADLSADPDEIALAAIDAGADLILGQPDNTTTRCRQDAVDANSLCYPMSVAVDADGLMLVDAFGRRRPVRGRCARFRGDLSDGPYQLVHADRQIVALCR